MYYAIDLDVAMYLNADLVLFNVLHIASLNISKYLYMFDQRYFRK